MSDLPSITPGIRDILDFWFLPLSHPDHGKRRDIWWQSTTYFDTEIATRFSAALDRAVAGELDAWRASPDGALALTLLCDQFPRNIHRRSAKAFRGDAKALETARLALARGYPAVFLPEMRAFFYVPFEHSESLADQEFACTLFAALPGADYLEFAAEHRDVVARFGRFPHRNEVLGRASTPDELVYLKDAKRYGQ